MKTSLTSRRQTYLNCTWCFLLYISTTGTMSELHSIFSELTNWICAKDEVAYRATELGDTLQSLLQHKIPDRSDLIMIIPMVLFWELKIKQCSHRHVLLASVQVSTLPKKCVWTLAHFPIESYSKQVQQSGVLWKQNASNCCKYDVVSIFTTKAYCAVEDKHIGSAFFILDAVITSKKSLDTFSHWNILG